MKMTRWLSLSMGIALLLVLVIYQPDMQTAAAQANPTPEFVEAVVLPEKLFLPAVVRYRFVASPPLASPSYYMTTVDPAESYALGCELGTRDKNQAGTQDSLVVLDYGIPREKDGVLGASGMWRTGFVNLDQIAVSVQNYGLGYYKCTGGDWDSRLLIAIGTNNYHTGIVTAAHGKAWAEMVNKVNEWLVAQGLAKQVTAVGANDIELNWNSPENTFNWLNGYDSVNKYAMYNFGAVEGCPTIKNPGAQCGNYSTYLWSYEQVWFAIYGSPPVFPVPEIYLTSGINAEQWYMMSVYASTRHGEAIEFVGIMTQYQACLQNPGECEGIDNKPGAGWQQLTNLIMKDYRTVTSTPRYSTDIRWYGE